MITNREQLRIYLQEDANANKMSARYSFRGRIRYFALLLIGDETAHVIKYLYTLRHLEYWTNKPSSLWRNIIRKFWSIRHCRLSHRYGIHIGPNMVEQGLRIAHFAGGVIVNCEKMGTHCIVTTGVVIGNKNLTESRPIIGNNVEFAMGCKVYGKIIIGDNVRIAPNAVVFKDIPNNCAIGGDPACIIKTYE